MKKMNQTLGVLALSCALVACGGVVEIRRKRKISRKKQRLLLYLILHR